MQWLSQIDILLNYSLIRNFGSWENVFGNTHPLKVEIGCGKDDSLVERAFLEPETNFIGIEYDTGIAYRFERKVRHRGISNLRIILFDAIFVLEHLFQPNSIQMFLMQFPDPWPKRRHARRRLLNAPFVKLIRDKLIPEGEFFVATDVLDMAHLALSSVQEVGGFLNCTGDKIFVSQKPYPTVTLYEQKFLAQGLPIYYLRFRKMEGSKK